MYSPRGLTSGKHIFPRLHPGTLERRSTTPHDHHSNSNNALYLHCCLTIIQYNKVPMKRKLSLGSYKIYPFKHGISKFEIAGVKIADFVSVQSWAILLSKMVLESRGQNAR